MAEHPLDRPVWASLTGGHARLAVGTGPARRYDPEVNVFAGTRDESPESLEALGALVGPGEQVVLLQVPRPSVPHGLVVRREALGVQLVALDPVVPEPGDDERVVDLGPDDAADMVALAALTEPGPFLAGTHRMGRFVGIRERGCLVAMAGERMRPPGFVEVSGVCTHPDVQGRGYARRLSRLVAARAAAEGSTAFLHAWATNVAALALYESLGFVRRTEVEVAVIGRD
ncbi:MAG: GNAT family N-acetyltransferase [Actinomycetales bacterium]|nr:GNAT family N-acetyltransferase [Actinomycetales bacterium]